MASSRLKKEIYKMGLEHLLMPEGKEVLKKHSDGAMSKSQLKEFSMAKAVRNLEPQNKVEMHYNQ